MAARVIFVLLIAGLAYLQWKLWFDRGSIPRAAQLERDLATLNAKNEAIRQRNAEGAADVRELERGGDAVEERARSELGMVRKGENFVQVREPKPGIPSSPAAPAGNAAAPAR